MSIWGISAALKTSYKKLSRPLTVHSYSKHICLGLGGKNMKNQSWEHVTKSEARNNLNSYPRKQLCQSRWSFLCTLPVLGRSADRVLARSSAVGSSILHPACSVACAADWIVFRTPILLANSTTCCFRLDNKLAFGPKPTEFTSTLWLIIACSWNKQQKPRLEHKAITQRKCLNTS